MNEFGDGAIEFGRNGAVDVDRVVQRTRERLVLDDWNRVLLCDFPNSESDEIEALGQHDGCPALRADVAQRDRVMSRIDDDHRRSGHRGQHAPARTIEPQGSEPRLHRTIALGLLGLLLDLLFAHSLVVAPMNSRPGQVGGGDDGNRQQHRGDRLGAERQQPQGKIAGVHEHRGNERVALPAQNQPDDDRDRAQLQQALEKFRPAARPERSDKTFAYRQTWEVRHDPRQHDPRRVLEERTCHAERHDQDDRRRQKSRAGHHDDLCQPEDVGRTLQPPPRGIVDEVQKYRNQARGRRGQREQCDEQIRHERQQKGSLARDRHAAAFDRVVEPFLGRLLGLAVGVGFVAHGVFPLCQAAGAGSASGNSISPRCAILRIRSVICFRALEISAGVVEPGLASSPSTNRREREAIADRTGSRNSTSVPRSASTMTSVEILSNRSARARCGSRGKSLNENKRARSALASWGLSTTSIRMTSSASVGSSPLMISAIRARLSSPEAPWAAPSRLSRNALSKKGSAPGAILGGAINWHSTWFRRSRGRIVTALAAAAGPTRERMKVAVSGCSDFRNAANVISGKRPMVSQISGPRSPVTCDRISAICSGGTTASSSSARARPRSPKSDAPTENSEV